MQNKQILYIGLIRFEIIFVLEFGRFIANRSEIGQHITGKQLKSILHGPWDEAELMKQQGNWGLAGRIGIWNTEMFDKWE